MFMKKIYLGVLVMVLTCFFSSCSTINTIHFDRLEAAQISFPDMVKKVGIVNNMPSVTDNEQRLAEPDIWLEGDGKYAAEALAQQVAATRYFDEVIICDSAICPLKVDFNEGQENMLSMEQVNEWVDKLGVDMLFSLDRVSIHLKKGMAFTDYMQQVPVVDGIIHPVLRVYVPHRNKPFLTISKKDTIYWNPIANLDLSRVVKESSEYSASILLPVLLPYWEEDSRNYYDGGGVEMRDAGVYLREDNWEEASILWKKVYDSKKGKQKMKAAFNLALYHELQGEFDKAESYIDTAIQLAKPDSFDSVMIQAYQIQLESLAKKHQKLRIQMKRFEDKN